VGFIFSEATGVEKLGDVKIDDLFIEESPIEEKLKEEEAYYTNPSIIPDEDFELESLEISDIDIVTFGEYEDFLNKYYDDNFLDINSKFIKQFEFNISTSIGTRLPAGANSKIAFDSGLDLGLTLSPNTTFKIFNKVSKFYGNLNMTQITPFNKLYAKYQITRFTGGVTSFINKNVFISSGLSIISSKGGTIVDSNSSFGSSINFDLGYQFNLIKQINTGLYVRGQSMLWGSLDPPIDGGGTLETFSIGLIFDSPVYLMY
jgi:hypothetical protein